mmetsp:Transcript_28150/g.65113  ORF Transcript_28150/g.65113 Transcript_28150/m.65113 type:complete len:201 (+) Transcript_28150:97-699(+)
MSSGKDRRQVSPLGHPAQFQGIGCEFGLKQTQIGHASCQYDPRSQPWMNDPRNDRGHESIDPILRRCLGGTQGNQQWQHVTQDDQKNCHEHSSGKDDAWLPYIGCKTGGTIEIIEIPKQIIQKGAPINRLHHPCQTPCCIVLDWRWWWCLEPSLRIHLEHSHETKYNKGTHGHETESQGNISHPFKSTMIDVNENDTHGE